MKNIIRLLSAMVVVFVMSSCMNNNTKRPKNYNHLIDDGSVAFIQQGLEDGEAEIEASKVAQSVSKNPRILSYAKMIVTDHAAMGDELEKIAINNKVRGGDSISTDHQKNIVGIKALSGGDFDKAYIQMMVNTHQSAVKSFRTASTDKIEEIQKFARKILPTLKLHLDSANSICADLK
jgi:putative membrane protein